MLRYRIQGVWYGVLYRLTAESGTGGASRAQDTAVGPMKCHADL